MKPKPRFRNACAHPKGSFVGTVAWLERGVYVLADVYVFEPKPTSGVQHVCLRTGPEGPDYISPGTVLDMMLAGYECKIDSYRVATKLIREHFKVRFVRKEAE